MPRITSKQIGQAIEQHTGIKHVLVWRGEGYQYFYSDHEETATALCRVHTSVYVFRLSDLTLDQWVEYFVEAIADEIIEGIVEAFSFFGGK